MRGLRTGLVAAAVAALAACGGTTPQPAGPTSPPSASASPTATATPRPTPTATSSAPPTPTATSSPTASPTPTPQPAGVLRRLPTTARVVALTFDAGAGAQGVPAILATLARERVPATFFLTGAFATARPGAARDIAAAGHLLGDHTVDHPHLPALPDVAVRAEVTAAADTITRVTGCAPAPWFRFPYGDSDPRTEALVAGLGFRAVGWTVDTLGWKGRSAGTAADVVGRVAAALAPGAIVLMHVGANPDDGTTFDADALPQVVAAVRAAGYGFTTVAGDGVAP